MKSLFDLFHNLIHSNNKYKNKKVESQVDENVQKPESENTDEFTMYTVEDITTSQYKSVPITYSTNFENSNLNKIKNMREIQLIDFYNDTQLFIRQAKFMEDFEDDYEKNIPFQCYYPKYNYMNNEQLRCFFTWRAKVRNGLVERTSLSYIYVYIYELINNIGVKNCMDAIEKLIFIWQEYRKEYNNLDKYLIDWIKDYYICNDFSCTFEEITYKYHIHQFYPTILSEKELISFEYLSKISSYDFEKSNFLNSENINLFKNCFNCIIDNLKSLLNIYGLNWTEIILGDSETEYNWKPFKNAVYQPVIYKNKEVKINDLEFYSCFNNIWSCKTREYNNWVSTFIDYIINRTEADLRKLLDYKYKLSVEPEILIREFKSGYHTSPTVVAMVQDEYLNQIIDSSVSECYKKSLQNSTEYMDYIAIPETQKLNRLVTEFPYALFYNIRKMDKDQDIDSQFIQHACLLSDLVDDYQIQVPNDIYMPTYNIMTNSQLRSYFSWRTKARFGKYVNTELSNIMLYMNELINDIGVESCEDTVEKLTDILINYRKIKPNIEYIVPSLIKDYYLCNVFPYSFTELTQKFHLEPYYPNLFINNSEFDNKFELYTKISSYKIKQSKFYSESTYPILKDCFNYTIPKVISYFKKYSLDFTTVILGKTIGKMGWCPFIGFYYVQKKEISDKVIVLCENESYQYQNNNWECILSPEGNPMGISIVGYVLKRMEARIRESMKFKYKLSPNINSLLKNNSFGTVNPKQVIKAISDPCFDSTIDNAVYEYFKNKNSSIVVTPPTAMPTHIHVDVKLLDNIRQKAFENQQKLTVVEASENQYIFDLQVNTDEQNLNQEGEWDNLFKNLSYIQIQVIEIILSGKDTTKRLREIADNSGQFIEVLIESINEQSIQFINDNIINIENDMIYIYDEYIKDISNIIRR